MRTGLIIGRQKDGKAVLLSGPEVPIDKQKTRFKELVLEKGDQGGLASIELWESGAGLKKRHRIDEKPRVVAPAPAPARAPKKVKAEPKKHRGHAPAAKPAPEKPKETTDDVAKELEEMSDEALAALVTDLKIEVPEGAKREEIIALVLKATEAPTN